MPVARFQFGQVVVLLSNNDICCICKTWAPSSPGKEFTYDVYCRNANGVIEVLESDVKPFVFDKTAAA